MRARQLLLLGLVPACGRYGFREVVADVDATTGGTVPGDVATVDGPVGNGSYAVTQTTAPYALLGGQAVPGFGAGADDENYTLTLPFPFTFYGISYAAVTVSMNGYATFAAPLTGTETYLNDCPLDGTPPDAAIAVFWDDLYATAASQLDYATSGTAPDRLLAIEWRDMDAFYQVGGGKNAFTQGIAVTQMLVLHETGVIELHYGPRTAPTTTNKDCGADRHRGCSATVGLTAPGSSVLDTVQCGTAAGPMPGYTPIDEGRMITFTPQ